MVYDNLVAICKENNITFQQIEVEAHLGSGCLSRWKNDKISPNVATLKKVAAVLKIPVADLLKD